MNYKSIFLNYLNPLEFFLRIKNDKIQKNKKGWKNNI